MIRNKVVVALALVFGAVVPANAFVFEQPPDNDGGWWSNSESQLMADNFTWDGSDVLSICFWGGYGLGGSGGFFSPPGEERSAPSGFDGLDVTDHFTITIYSDSGGPSSVVDSFDDEQLVVTRSDTGIFTTELGLEVFKYSANFGAGVSLGDATYHLSVTNALAPGDGAWFWGTSSTGDGAASSGTAGDWFPEDADLAFRLDSEASTVPEPTTLSIVGLGLFGLAWGSYRRRRHADQSASSRLID